MMLFTRVLFVFLMLVATGFASTTQAANEVSDSSVLKEIPSQTSLSTETKVDSLSAKKHAVWIKLEGDVEPSMFDFCARAIDDALKENPDYIVFEINTFGGRLDAAFDLVDTIMAIKGPTTIALVKKKAISAGSLIALDHRRLCPHCTGW